MLYRIIGIKRGRAVQMFMDDQGTHKTVVRFLQTVDSSKPEDVAQEEATRLIAGILLGKALFISNDKGSLTLTVCHAQETPVIPTKPDSEPLH